ncbi:MAG: 4-hydroxy-tetrahydrodipicolinate synthase [Bacteroidales bacterium]|nr:4-hydroxy-tetrahydrodipicolinate synthase [Bacteroidales bacterium]
MSSKEIYGTGVALVTPFHASGQVDFSSLSQLVNHVIDGGVNFIVALGTTAETATLNRDERAAVLQAIVDVVDQRLPIVVGMGSNNTRELVQELRDFDFEGIDGILSVAPYYSKPNQRGIYEHFKQIAMATELPIIIYNVPGRTSSNISAETCIKLANDFENIIAVKEASGDLMQVMEIIKNRPAGFSVFSGDDALTLPSLAVGADGVISVIANAFPKSMSEMVAVMLSDNDRYIAMAHHYQMLDVINAIFSDGNPAGIKALLDHLGIVKNTLRLPMVKVNRALNLELKKYAIESGLE